MSQESRHHDYVDIRDRYFEPLIWLTWLLFTLLLRYLGIDWLWFWAVTFLLSSLVKIALVRLLNLNLTSMAYSWFSKCFYGVAAMLTLYILPLVAGAETNQAIMAMFRFLMVWAVLILAYCIVGFVKSVKNQ